MKLEVFICMECENRMAAAIKPKRCTRPTCGKGVGFIRQFSEASYTLAGMENYDKERGEAKAIAQGEDLTAMMLQPKADVSAMVGSMERDSPLFFGTGSNPTLF